MAGGGTRRPHRPTQADVAQRAGVSQALVSYVVNDSPTVPEQTRRRVRLAMQELGYTPNRVAQALRTRRTMTLALVIPDITNPHYPAVERGVQETAESFGYQLITYNTDGDPAKERSVLRAIADGGPADGAVVHGFHLAAADFTVLLDAGLAVAAATTDPKSLGDLPIDRMVVNTAAGAEMVTAYLVGLGRLPVATVTGSLDADVGRSRFEGYRAALRKAGIEVDPSYVVEADFTYDGGRAAMETLLARPLPPRAVFASNDLMALGALGIAQDRGLRVPQDVAVAGFDDIDVARMVTPRLTTVRQPQRDIGRQMAELVLERLGGDLSGPHRTVETSLELVVRESA